MTLSYRFTVDPDAYAKGHGIEIKDKGNGNEGSEQKPAEGNDNGEAQKADSAVAQDEANDSQRPVSECNANNPVTCPYHGMQLIQHEIEERVHAILPEAQINLTRPVRGQRNTYDLQINFNGQVTPAQQRRVARAMDQFFNGAGVTEDHVEGETTRRGHSSMFDIDELDPHYGEGRGTTVEHRDDAGRNRAVPPAEGRRLLREAAQNAIREGIRRREQARAEAARRNAGQNNGNANAAARTAPATPEVNTLEAARQQVAAKRSELGNQETSHAPQSRPDVTAPDFGGNESLSAIFGNAANRANARRKGTQNNG